MSVPVVDIEFQKIVRANEQLLPHRYHPFFEYNSEDEGYVKEAEQLRLPEFTKKHDLKLWETELNEIAENHLWANLGFAPNPGPGEKIRYSWLFKYRQTISGLIPVSESPMPSSKRLMLPATRGGLWFLRCTNMRLVAHTKHIPSIKYLLTRRRNFWVIHFPLGMLSCVDCKYEYDSLFSGEIYYLRLLFCYEDENYLLSIGDFKFKKAYHYTTSIYRIALRVKIQFAESIKEHALSSEIERKADALLTTFRKELDMEITANKKGMRAYQTHYARLNRLMYFDHVISQIN